MGNTGALRQRKHHIFSLVAGKKENMASEKNNKNTKLANYNKRKLAERRNSLLGNEM